MRSSIIARKRAVSTRCSAVFRSRSSFAAFLSSTFDKATLADLLTVLAEAASFVAGSTLPADWLVYDDDEATEVFDGSWAAGD